MGNKLFKPTSPGRRFQVGATFEELTRSEPEKSLLRPLSKTGGRNARGRITCRHRGGGHKRRFRLIDFKRDKYTIPATVASIEYDPNRSARIALLHYHDGEKRYILAPLELGVGDVVTSGEKVEIKPGNALPLRNIPVGTVIHNVELKPKKGAQLIRSAGAFGQLMAQGVTLSPNSFDKFVSCGLVDHVLVHIRKCDCQPLENLVLNFGQCDWVSIPFQLI